jgi:DNA-binding beta-propeller fold protein YncE
MAVDTRTGRVFVATLFGRGVSVLDARSGRILRTIAMDGQNLYMVALAERTGRLFAITADHVNVLDARSGRVLRTVRVGDTPLAVAVDAQTGRAVVTAHSCVLPP